MNYLYSLYDALVSISVPADKARAVVDAMEREMGTTLATKQDLLLLRQELDGRYSLLDQKLDTLRGDMAKDLASLELRMTVKLGSMIVACFGLTLAAMRVWI
jgi:hypothetical protein